jgi:hypothetical protein
VLVALGLITGWYGKARRRGFDDAPGFDHPGDAFRLLQHTDVG